MPGQQSVGELDRGGRQQLKPVRRCPGGRGRRIARRWTARVEHQDVDVPEALEGGIGDDRRRLGRCRICGERLDAPCRILCARLAATSRTRASFRAQMSRSQPSCASRRAAASPRPGAAAADDRNAARDPEIHGRKRTDTMRTRRVVRKEGLEPSRPHGHQLLRLACLPFHHFRVTASMARPDGRATCR